jgi:phage N-6-adenine-methyltransferase
MNHYAHDLARLQRQPDHELKQIGDQWQTPKALAWGLFHHFSPMLGPLVLDMFADDSNHLLPNYYTAADNALTQDLAADLRKLGGAAFGNPPYSRPCVDGDGNPITGMDHILAFCRAQREQGAKIMLLIKAATSETWWPEDADFIQFISGRVSFEVPSWYTPRDPKKDKPSSSGFASAVVIFDAGWKGEHRPEARLRRDDLITTGQIILGMIHHQAIALNEHTNWEMANERAKPASQASAQCDPRPIEQPDRVGPPLDIVNEQGADTDKSLADWAFDYQNDQLNLGDTPWPTFVAVLTMLFGLRDTYSPREVAIAISISDEQLMDEYTSMPKHDRERLRSCINALQTVELQSPLDDHQRQVAVCTLSNQLAVQMKEHHQQIAIMTSAIDERTSHEAAA